MSPSLPRHPLGADEALAVADADEREHGADRNQRRPRDREVEPGLVPPLDEQSDRGGAGSRSERRVLEGVEREHPYLAVPLARAPSPERFAVERGAALRQKGAEPDRDELRRLAQAEMPPSLDGGDRSIGQHVRAECDELGHERDREPERREVRVEPVDDLVPARDRGHRRERSEEENRCERRGRSERQPAVDASKQPHPRRLPAASKLNTQGLGSGNPGTCRACPGVDRGHWRIPGRRTACWRWC